MHRIAVFFVVVSVLLLALPAMAQDPTEVDSKHYKVVFENDQVRVLRITYGPYYTGVMHEHPANLVVWLTDGDGIIMSADGKAEEIDAKAGDVTWMEPAKHRGENTSDQPFEVIQIEIKATKAWKRVSGTAECAAPDKASTIEIPDQAGHSFMISQGPCTWDAGWRVDGIQSEQASFNSFEDMSGDSSRFHGVYVDKMANGDQIRYRYKGKSILSEGQFQSGESKWKIVGGTGKFENLKGKGTCKGKPRADGGVTWACEGKYALSN